MASTQSALITPDLSKAARRELTLTQNNVIAETGIQAYKLKQFEAGRFRPDMACLRQLREFYESQGVDFSQLEAHAATTLPAVEKDVRTQRGLTNAAKPGFLIADHIPQDQLDRALTRMEENDERVFELIAQESQTGVFGGATGETEAALREIFGRMTENHLIFRFLQGKGIVTATKEDPVTVGEHFSNWVKDSPLYDVLTLSDDTAELGALEG